MRTAFLWSGIRNRRVAPSGVCGSDLAFQAASPLLDYYQIDRSTIDLLIFCSHTPDYLVPATACILQQRLGLKRQCACFDIKLGCSQYVYALSVAHSMITAGIASRALVLTGDTISQAVHPMDRSLVPLIGDGGTATLVGEVPDGQGFLGFELGTDGSGYQGLTIPAGGSRLPVSEETGKEVIDADGSVRTQQNVYMNGAAIFNFALSVVPETVCNLVARLSLSAEDVDLFLFHQASQYLLACLMKKLKIGRDKTHFFLENVGNTTGSSVPMVLADAWRAGKIRTGSLVLMIGFGDGLSWGASLLRWPENCLGVVPEVSVGSA